MEAATSPPVVANSTNESGTNETRYALRGSPNERLIAHHARHYAIKKNGFEYT
jgi:hypothetical protein